MELRIRLTNRPNEPLKGIAAIVTAVFLLSFSDALVKQAGSQFGLAQLILLRSLVAVVFLIGWIWITAGFHALHVKRTPWVWARSLCMVAMWLCYYVALQDISLSLAATCYYTAPIWMAVMSRLFLGEEMSKRGWLSIALTLSGVALALELQSDNVSPVLLLPLAAAGFYALSGLITRSRCQEENADAVAVHLNMCLCTAAMIGIGALYLSRSEDLHNHTFITAIWPDLNQREWFLVTLLGGLLAIASMLVVFAYSYAPTSIVGVFDTSYVGFAVLWGVIFFSETPTLQQCLGLSLIAIGAMLMSWRGVTNRRFAIPTKTAFH